MAGFSHAIVLGRIGNEVVLQGGKNVNFLVLSVAVNKTYKSKKTGQWAHKHDWIPVMAFGLMAERLADRLRRGDLIHVMGTINVQTSMYNGKKSTRIYVNAEKVKLVKSNPRNPKKIPLDENYGVDPDEIEDDPI